MATDVRKKATRDAGRKVYRLTVDQVMRMVDAGILPESGHMELWDGVLYQMTRNEPHTFIVSELADALRRMLPPDCHLREEKPLRYGENSLPEPDIAVVPRPRRAYQNTWPLLTELALVVEVCCTTERADRGVKLRRYAEAGIPIYWLIDWRRRQVEVRSEPTGRGRGAIYSKVEIYPEDRDFPVVIDGRGLGRLAVADVLPGRDEGDAAQPAAEPGTNG